MAGDEQGERATGGVGGGIATLPRRLVRPGQVSDLRPDDPGGLFDDESQGPAMRSPQPTTDEAHRLAFFGRFRRLYALYTDAGKGARAQFERKFTDRWGQLVDEYERLWPGIEPPSLYLDELLSYKVRWPKI
jgi:hypothetical protein